MRGISKTFPGVKALDDVSLKLYPGSVTALIGENGAGKSTLVKILTGVYQSDEGQILLNNEPIKFIDALDATRVGVTAIHQETVLFDELSVAENIFLGQEPRTKLGLIDWGCMEANAAKVLQKLGTQMSPRTILKDLTIGHKHMVAIARALSTDARIVIMDEPTAALSNKEAEELYDIVDWLKSEGKAILFISHKFEDVFRIADRYTVFRDGQLVGAGMLADVERADLVKKMVGRSVDRAFPKNNRPGTEVVLKVENYCHPTEFDSIDFELKRGEILGVYGLVGAGRTEVAQSLFGATHPSHGKLHIEGQEITIRSPDQAIAAGLVYVPEDRGKQGVTLEMSIAENIGMSSLKATSKQGFLDLAHEYDVARKYADRLDLRASALNQSVGSLSGGNQQKVVIGKWLATLPKVIILDEPTKGIDIGSKAAVHSFMSELAEEGLSVLMISSEIPEVLGMSDRVLVMREGLIVGEFDQADATPEKLVNLATGNIN
ncbi:sugar ABC transporter ATP-binding protein [Pseudovibrio sp. Tun.PSC04-5.I4]|uniref:sugar ABC transporter ATP-binding protein n=1 Tax=Pseudovibrio sp. Tun.PSC04-5.I4 TaxID=1798213 RepID=UPI001FCBAC60|nr:sugar ABC transporter ATP-binding protein [Pseudovibrio sp. Tun.PSC04-5.I4]